VVPLQLAKVHALLSDLASAEPVFAPEPTKLAAAGAIAWSNSEWLSAGANFVNSMLGGSEGVVLQERYG